MRILVTEGVNKNTLAILRTLGKRYWLGITTSFPRPFTLGSYSRYCRRTHILHSDINDLEGYTQELLGIIEKGRYDLLIPVGLRSCLAASKYKALFQQKTKVVIADWSNMQVAYNRDRAMILAKELDVPIPETCVLDHPGGLENISAYPVVLKTTDEKKGVVRYCNSRDELENLLLQLQSKGRKRIIAQEYIRGFGCGFYGVYDQGRLVAHFLHRRIKEFPITGGSSAVGESYFDEKLLDYGKRLGDALKWHGPIMAEFKYDIENDEYKLIEINPKLWGSLDLTIAAGVDIPDMLVKIARGEKVNGPEHYDNIRYRWVFPDEFKVLMSQPSPRRVAGFLLPHKKERTNLVISDPLPTVIQIGRGLMLGGMLLLRKKKRFPHGRIKTETEPGAVIAGTGTWIVADLHIHSKYSFDSLLEPRKIMSLCRKKGYNLISITDHNSIQGSLEAKHYESEFGVKVLLGEEVLTDVGDIIGIGLKQEIRSRKAIDVLEEIHRQGGISILPHPYKGHQLSDELVRNVDIIEGFNSRVSEKRNIKAVELAKKWRKPIVAGSDAHITGEIGLAKNVILFPQDVDFSRLLDAKIKAHYSPSPSYFTRLSQVIRIVKKREYWSVPGKLARLAGRKIRGGDGS